MRLPSPISLRRPAALAVAAVLSGGLLVAGCASAPPPSDAELETEEPPLLGVVERHEIELERPDWVEAEIEAAPDPEAARRLASAAAGAELTVFLGTWCSDSRREVARFWRAIDELGPEPPLPVTYVGVDRDKLQPAELVAGAGLLYVPTFIVRRDGRELGRVVESAPGGIEGDLAALLAGEAAGVVTGRDDLGPAGEPE